MREAVLHSDLGVGLGLRPPHYQDILNNKPTVDWFEILTENFLVEGGPALYYLDQIASRYPVVMHGVSMSLGSTDPLNWDYIKKVKKLSEKIKAKWISDHLCWTGIQKVNLHDLLPLPYIQEAITHVVDRIKQVQDFLGRRFVIENVSSYIDYKQSVMPEWEFLASIAEAADCSILLDVNNIYVSSYNHGFDPNTYIQAIPSNRVQQFHIAGHTNLGEHIIDTHDNDIIDAVWALYALAVKRFPNASTLIERDDNIPALDTLLQEVDKARAIKQAAMLDEGVVV